MDLFIKSIFLGHMSILGPHTAHVFHTVRRFAAKDELAKILTRESWMFIVTSVKNGNFLLVAG